METSQKMVDEAARAAGYDMHLYHGSKSGGGFTVFKGWQYRNEYGMGDLQESGLPDWTDGYDLSDIIEENDLDYDGIILDEGCDLVNGKPVSRGVSCVIRSSEQIKSADPVTYDDNGKVIPLSERFKTEQKDIRYSDREASYTYENLVSKPDIKITVIDDNQKFTPNAQTRKDIV